MRHIQWTGLLLLATIMIGCNPSSTAVTSTSSNTDSSANNTPATPATPSTPSTPSVPPRPSTAVNLKVCAAKTTVPGVDVSDYDTNIQWPTVQHSGVGFTYIKATEGTTFTNRYFAGDWTATKSNGILRGAYHFFHPGDDPTVQANFFVKTMGALGDQDLPPMMDWEVTDGVSKATNIANALTFLQLVQKATGKTPIIYLDPSYFNALGNPQAFAQYPLYIADYKVSCPTIPPPWSQWVFWQTGLGPAAGVGNDTDLDVFNGTTAQLLQFAKTGSY